MRFAVKPWLEQIWHAPDHFRLMEPLPPLHRRGIIFAALLIVIGVLLPSDDDTPLSPAAPTPMQAGLVPPAVTPGGVAQSGQVPIPQTNNDIAQQWRSWRIASGQTLAQLFRDNNLPPADVYAMAQVEGDGKPLSNLQSGQMVKIRQNANGVVTGLMIDMGDNRQALFLRQPDGSFLRAR